MGRPSAPRATESVARTIRFPGRLRQRIVDDAARCGRSFEAQVLAILRRHYGEDVDIAPAPATIIALARGSVAGLTRAEQRDLFRPLKDERT
jgi:hypothetical protein